MPAIPKKEKPKVNMPPVKRAKMNPQLGLVTGNNSADENDKSDEESDDTHVKLEEWAVFNRRQVVKKK